MLPCVSNVNMFFRFLPELNAKLLQETKLSCLSKFRDSNKDTDQIKDEKRATHINVPQNGSVVGKVRTIVFFVFFYTVQRI